MLHPRRWCLPLLLRYARFCVPLPATPAILLRLPLVEHWIGLRFVKLPAALFLLFLYCVRRSGALLPLFGYSTHTHFAIRPGYYVVTLVKRCCPIALCHILRFGPYCLIVIVFTHLLHCLLFTCCITAPSLRDYRIATLQLPLFCCSDITIILCIPIVYIDYILHWYLLLLRTVLLLIHCCIVVCSL